MPVRGEEMKLDTTLVRNNEDTLYEAREHLNICTYITFRFHLTCIS